MVVMTEKISRLPPKHAFNNNAPTPLVGWGRKAKTMACNVELRANGKSYPRTCADCKLAPCTKGHNKSGGYEVPSALPASLFLVRNDKTEKMVITRSEAEAEAMAELLDGKHEEVPVVSIPR